MKKQHQEIIAEIKHCEKAIEERFDVYVANAISRLIEARIKLNSSLVEEAKKEVS